MGKASGVSRRRKKRYNYKRNVKRLHQKLITMPKVKCKQLQEAWDGKKSYYKNMEEFGLSEDPNKTIGTKVKRKAKKMEVVNDLEAEANAPRPKTMKLPTEPMKFCVYMIEKYGDDYGAMARDTKNYYQATPAQIKKKINKFKSVPSQWNGYLRAKGLIESGLKQDEYQIDIGDIMQETTVTDMEQ
ncbi:nucleolar protein 16 [Parasteatoda tepidariorum]|uniref:nucleolar protein 16 n=1 Tax=Parasteatoda tepidariorum TaxID=114398 RepID=UPI00077FAE9D|nr:nucleolar protein 16 [Parasteatoda tepidariorum]